MAVNNLPNFNLANDSMAMPLSMQRGNPNPLDTTDLYSSYEDAVDYAKNSAVAYIGQVIGTVKESTNADTGATEYEVHLYQIADADGTLTDIGGGTEAVFSDSRWTSLKDIVDTLNGDETVVGSVKYYYSQSIVTMEKTTESGVTKYTFYQGTHEETNPVFDTDGVTPLLNEDGTPQTVTTTVKTKIGTVSIDADVFVDSAKVVTVTKNVDPTTGETTYVDSDGDTPPSGVTEGTYIKMKMSSGDVLYISTSDLTNGLIKEIKMGTYTYSADSEGVVDITSVPVDLLVQATGDLLILNCGGAS